jgi:hypothetical protein
MATATSGVVLVLLNFFKEKNARLESSSGRHPQPRCVTLPQTQKKKLTNSVSQRKINSSLTSNSQNIHACYPSGPLLNLFIFSFYQQFEFLKASINNWMEKKKRGVELETLLHPWLR